jgi:hypothetical protein
MVKNSNEYRDAVKRFGIDLVDALYYNDHDTLITGIKSVLASVKGTPGGNAWFWILAIEPNSNVSGYGFALVEAWCSDDGWVGESKFYAETFHTPQNAARGEWAENASLSLLAQLEKAK